MKKINSVEDYIEINSHFKKELILLRGLISETELFETVKWNAPVYTLNSKNVIGLAAFKQHFCIWFFNGVFLKDQAQLLVNAQENKTKALRQMRFTNAADINKPTVLAYIKEAIENEKQGKALKPTRISQPVKVPPELKQALSVKPNLKLAFEKLTVSKQREYCEHIGGAKQAPTRLRRLDKCIPMIIKGAGLNDKYKNC